MALKILDKLKSFFTRLSEIKYPHNPCNSYDTKVLGGFSLLDAGGDEISCSIMHCERCDVYFLRCYHDSFVGDDDFSFEVPLEDEAATQVLEGIRRCPTPRDKHCRCPHHDLFYRIVMAQENTPR